MSRGVLAVFADRARRPADAGAVDRAPQRSQRHGGLDRRDDLLGVRHVAVDVGAADLLGDLCAEFIVEVGEDHFDPARRQARAVASPSPEAPPVTTAEVLLSSMVCS